MRLCRISPRVGRIYRVFTGQRQRGSGSWYGKQTGSAVISHRLELDQTQQVSLNYLHSTCEILFVYESCDENV